MIAAMAGTSQSMKVGTGRPVAPPSASEFRIRPATTSAKANVPNTR